jgi:hypothetical protein
MVTNLSYVSGNLRIGDDTSIPTYARASYGILAAATLCETISCALISVSYLSHVLKLSVFYSFERAYILKFLDPKTSDPQVTDLAASLQVPFRIVATATLHRDQLYHKDDMRVFLKPLSSDTIDQSRVPKALLFISPEPYTDREIKYGGARVFVKSSRQYLTLLQWCLEAASNQVA